MPQAAREREPAGDWNRLELNAIGSAFGRDRTGWGTDVESCSAAIIAELTR